MKSKLIRSFLLLFVVTLLTTTAQAQVSAGGTPPSQSLANLSAPPTVTMAKIDVNDYIAEDKLQPKDVPPRFGVPFDVSLNLKNSGVWTDLPGGDRLWRLRIESEGAYSINLIYDRFYMPEGGKFFLYNDNYRYVIGAFTDYNNKETGMFSTQPVPDDAITLEYLEPASARGEGEISLMTVVHAYRNMFGYRDSNNLDDFGESGSCNNNVACDTEWDDEERGVVVLLTSGGYRYCSGSLINNVNEDATPYILTANHCSPGNTDIAMFNYKSPNCSPTTDGPTYQTVSSGTQRFTTSTSSSSDCFLWELSVDVPTSYNPYFNGWNANNSAASSAVGIHHPSCDVMKISWENAALTSTEYLSNTVNSSQDHWRVADWDDGTTEGGSSGSPLFDPNHRIVGQLHGGYAACGNNESDWYGKLSYSMTSGLRSWLDPSNTGVMTLDGYDPNTASPTITVTSPNTAVTWLVGSAYSITWTSSGLSENVQIHINRTYPGGAWETITSNTANDGSYSWTVTGGVTSSARIRVRGVTSTTVSDESDVNFTIAERTITVTNPNTAVTWYAGDSQTIQWSSQYITGNVVIELNRSYSGGVWDTLAASTTNDGSFAWVVETPTSSSARVRISSLSYPTATDVSNTNFTIAERTITVTNPNTALTWVVDADEFIEWTSSNVTGNVKIELNRDYPGSTWETIIATTTNDGSYEWSVTSPLTTTARIRVTSVTYPSVSDISDTDFSIAQRAITVTSPNTAVSWYSGDSHDITWTSSNITGNVSIELNRDYSEGTWETITSSTADDGTYAWTVTLPATSTARIRVTSLTYLTVSDVSDANFSIINSNDPPAIAHDRLDDQNFYPFDVTAYVTDDAAGFVARLFTREVGAVDYDSVELAPTYNGDEYAVAILKPVGTYEYFLRVIDAEGLTDETSLNAFTVQDFFGLEQVYDDDGAEASQWSETADMKWAVKFDAGEEDYVLSNIHIGVSTEKPTSDYSDLVVSIYLADGLDGLPGTQVAMKSVGSLGNVIGGVPTTQDNFVDVVFLDAANEPLVLTDDFYVAVENSDGIHFDAFLLDENGTLAGRSFVYNSCEDLWIDETSAHESARPGNRMIRVSGFSLIPPVIVVSLAGTDIRLDWEDTGAPYYHVYSALNADGPFTTLEGTATTNSFVDIDPLADELKFYVVRSSMQP
ncbi:hypothetical protein KKG66_07695 [bacterium]|nr:hypothetical protein [bacterium]